MAAFILIKTSLGDIYTGNFDLLDLGEAHFRGLDHITVKVSRPGFPINFEGDFNNNVSVNVRLTNVNNFIDNFSTTNQFDAKINFSNLDTGQNYISQIFSVPRTDGDFTTSINLSLPQGNYRPVLGLYEGIVLLDSFDKNDFIVGNNNLQLSFVFDLRRSKLSGQFTLLRDTDFNFNRAEVVLEKQNPSEGERRHFYSNESLLTNDENQTFNYEVVADGGLYLVYLDFRDENGNWAENKYLPNTITLIKGENKILNLTLDIRTAISTPTPTALPAKTCTVTKSSSNLIVGQSILLSTTGKGNKASGENVRLWLQRTDQARISPNPGSWEWLVSGIYSYLLNECTSSNFSNCTADKSLSNLPVGDYYFFCDMQTLPPGPMCSGNPSCADIGVGSLNCHGMIRCSIPNDRGMFSVLPLSLTPTPTLTRAPTSTPTPTPNCSGCHYQSPNLDCTYPYSTPFLNCDRINPSSKCCLAGPTNTPTPTPTRTFSPTPTRVPTSPPTPTPTPLPQFGVCGGCTSDAQGGCTVPPGSHGQCRLLNDASACSQYGRSAPCCLYDEHCDPNFQYQCNESASVYCDKCHRYKNSSPWCSDNFQTDCGWGAPAKPRLKSPSLNQTINFNGQLNLSWYAFSEGLKSGCTSELLPNTWSVWQEDCEGDGSPDTHYGTVPNCKLDPGNERSCWGYTCAKGSFGIPAGWRFYKVFIKLSSLQNFTEICSLTDIPDSSADSGGYGGSLAADKTSCSFTPGQGGTYQWYVRAGYSVTTASGASTNYTDSNISTFTIIAPTNTPTPVPQGTCEYCRIYDQNWNQITNLSAIQLNQHVYLTTRGNTNASTANTKARFRVNQLAASYWCTGTGLTLVGNQWCETTLTHNNMFYVPFWFITSGSHTIESMVYNTSVGWY